MGHMAPNPVQLVWMCSYLTRRIACSRHVPLQGLACSCATVTPCGCEQIRQRSN